jgi:glycosyltransferase involved in cell wall biosynthesis
LLVTNHYPSYDDLYRNGFVHTRVRAYAENGIKVDIFRLRKDEPISWHEFQNADVTTGSQNALRKMLKSGRYRHVLVHFLDPNMWDVLKDFIDDIRVTIWVHGAEIHPWYRRKYNIETPEQEEKAKAQSAVRMSFWRGLLQPMPANLHLVFVSNYFSNEVMEDLGFRLPEGSYSVIHNPIDSELFNYAEKDSEQCRNILSVRPFATRQYANDLTVKCILELSKKPIFDQLRFTIVGDGVLFEETIKPLRQFDNVHIQQGFLTHPEIAALHKEHGIFLCPTRWDSQGVSRDEAMSSGLVPVTTAVAAIPEFADESCAIFSAEEDWQGLAKGIEELASRPDVFKAMSESASLRIKCQTEKSLIIPKEISLLAN